MEDVRIDERLKNVYEVSRFLVRGLYIDDPILKELGFDVRLVRAYERNNRKDL